MRCSVALFVHHRFDCEPWEVREQGLGTIIWWKKKSATRNPTNRSAVFDSYWTQISACSAFTRGSEVWMNELSNAPLARSTRLDGASEEWAPILGGWFVQENVLQSFPWCLVGGLVSITWSCKWAVRPSVGRFPLDRSFLILPCRSFNYKLDINNHQIYQTGRM